MHLTRLAISVSPVTILSVEYVEEKETFVWRVQLTDLTQPVDKLVIEMKRNFPKFLGPVSSSQLARLVRFAVQRSNGLRSPLVSKPIDLNKLNDDELFEQKRRMDILFLTCSTVKFPETTFITQWLKEISCWV